MFLFLSYRSFILVNIIILVFHVWCVLKVSMNVNKFHCSVYPWCKPSCLRLRILRLVTKTTPLCNFPLHFYEQSLPQRSLKPIFVHWESPLKPAIFTSVCGLTEIKKQSMRYKLFNFSRLSQILIIPQLSPSLTHIWNDLLWTVAYTITPFNKRVAISKTLYYILGQWNDKVSSNISMISGCCTMKCWFFMSTLFYGTPLKFLQAHKYPWTSLVQIYIVKYSNNRLILSLRATAPKIILGSLFLTGWCKICHISKVINIYIYIYLRAFLLAWLLTFVCERYLNRKARIGISARVQAVDSLQKGSFACALRSEGDVMVYILTPVHQHLGIRLIF